MCRHKVLLGLAILLLGLMGFLVFALDSAAGETHISAPLLEAALDRDSAEVGSMVLITLRYTLPEGAVLEEDTPVGGLQELTVITQEREPGVIRVKVLVDRLGSWTAGPFTFSYRDREGGEQTLSTDALSLTVHSNLGETPEEAELRPLQGIMPGRPFWVRYLPWVGGVLVVALAGVGLFLWHRRRQGSREAGAPPEPAHVRATKAIDELEASRIFEKGRMKEFYFLFSEILRRYLEDLRGFPAAEFTTQEISQHITEELDRQLVPLLRRTDLVKFADSVPTLARKQEDIAAARSYLGATAAPLEQEKTANSNQAP